MAKASVDFRLVKQEVSIEKILQHYGIDRLRKSRDGFYGRCPIHRGEGRRTFHVNTSKNLFYCFSCRAKGTVIDFVAAMEGCNARDAALKLTEWFGIAQGKPEVLQPSRNQPEKRDQVMNPPLPFRLQIDPKHEYGKHRGMTPETIEHFGVGSCVSQGIFSGRYVIPLHDPRGRLIGYAGRSLDQVEPKYRLPAGFRKSLVLFNFHRAVDTKKDWAILVEGFFDCMKVHQAGFPNVVALMGSTLSEAQHKLLLKFPRVVLFFDGDDAGRRATKEIAGRLIYSHLVRIVSLASGLQPDELSSEQLRRALLG